jgi:hypothetical protein
MSGRALGGFATVWAVVGVCAFVVAPASAMKAHVFETAFGSDGTCCGAFERSGLLALE